MATNLIRQLLPIGKRLYKHAKAATVHAYTSYRRFTGKINKRKRNKRTTPIRT